MTAFPAPAFPTGVTIEQRASGSWVVRRGEIEDAYVYWTRELAEAEVLGRAAIEEAERLIAAAVGGYAYGISVSLGDPAFPGGKRAWRRTDPHAGLNDAPFAWYSEQAPPIDVYTRSQYEAACAAVGLEPAPDAELGGYGDRYGQFAPPEYSADFVVVVELRRRRLAGIAREVTPPAAATQASVEDEPRDVMGPVQDRQAVTVATILGLPVPAATGNCHYCGLPLDRDGRCAECV